MHRMKNDSIVPNVALSVPSLIQPESNHHAAEIRQTDPCATRISNECSSSLPFQSIFSLSPASARSICALYTVYCKRYKKFSEILIIFFEDLFRLTHYRSYRILLFGFVVSYFFFLMSSSLSVSSNCLFVVVKFLIIKSCAML